MAEAHQLGGFEYTPWFIPVETRLGATCLNRAEPARTRAHVPQNHERGRAGAPALAHIRAPRALTHRMKLMLVDDVRDVFERLAIRELHAQPFWPLTFGVRHLWRLRLRQCGEIVA